MSQAADPVVPAKPLPADDRRQPYQVRQQRMAAAAREANASQDFPLLPTPDTAGAPAFPEEPDDKLTPGQRLAVAAIVAGQTFAAAARAAGVSRRTLYAWRQDADFAFAVERTSREALAVVVVRVRNMMLRATRVLSDAMDAERDASPLHAYRVLNSARLWQAAERES